MEDTSSVPLGGSDVARRKQQRGKLKMSTHERDKKGGYRDEHHLILEKIPPLSVVALRTELCLPQNSDIFNEAIKAPNFEMALATIGVMLDICLDGDYDAGELCDVLVSAMRARHTHSNQPHLRDSRLVNAEMIERAGTVSLEKVEREVATIAPAASVAVPVPATVTEETE